MAVEIATIKIALCIYFFLFLYVSFTAKTGSAPSTTDPSPEEMRSFRFLFSFSNCFHDVRIHPPSFMLIPSITISKYILNLRFAFQIFDYLVCTAQ